LSSFLVLKNYIGAYTMYVFAVVCAGFAIFAWKCVPETANATSIETLALLGQGPLTTSETSEILVDKIQPSDAIPPLRAVISPSASYHSP
jgi:hypothetical protein